MIAVNWLVSLPWPVFLAIWLPAVALMGTGLLRAGNWACDLAAGRRGACPDEGEGQPEMTPVAALPRAPGDPHDVASGEQEAEGAAR